MNRLMLAQVSDGDKLLVDLSGPGVDYEAVLHRIEREVIKKKENDEKVFEKCRCDGEAKCLRPFDFEGLYKVTDEEKIAMKVDECLCKNAGSRPMSFVGNFVVDKNDPRLPKVIF